MIAAPLAMPHDDIALTDPELRPVAIVPIVTGSSAEERLAARLAQNPPAAYAAIVALQEGGMPELVAPLSLAIIAAGGRIPDGTEYWPDSPAG